jgi:hypothetical protein
MYVAKKNSDFSAFLLCAVGSDGAMAHGEPIVHVSSSLEGQFWTSGNKLQEIVTMAEMGKWK